MNEIYLPFYEFDKEFNLIQEFQDILTTSNNKKIPNSKITAVYGSFPHTIWSGGRALDNCAKKYNLNELQERIQQINESGLIYKATFTNCLLEKTHLNDNYCNLICELLNNGYNNEIIVNSVILENYLRENYSNIALCSSVTKGHDLQTFQNNIYKDYKNVICYPKKEILNYISTLNLKEQNKIEIVLGSACAHCPRAIEHYNLESMNNLLDENRTLSGNCVNKGMHDLIIDYQLFNNLNINKFKIAGRNKGTEIQRLKQHYYNILLN